jgi:hypothetical protein
MVASRAPARLFALPTEIALRFAILAATRLVLGAVLGDGRPSGFARPYPAGGR